jgi:hypothetical protein
MKNRYYFGLAWLGLAWLGLACKKYTIPLPYNLTKLLKIKQLSTKYQIYVSSLFLNKYPF